MDELDRIDPVLLGRRLTLARKRCGLTQDAVAAMLGVSRPTFIAIEKGTRLPKPEEIVRLAKIYNRPLSELVRPDVPAVELHPHLRAVVSAKAADAEEIDAALAEFERLVADYKALEQMLNAPIRSVFPPEITLPPRGPIDEWAEDAAVRERARLGLGDQPVLNLRDLLEFEVGLRIFYWPLPSALGGMYAFSAECGPCILVNRKHPAEKRRATIVHEYGHFLAERHKPGVDYMDGSTRKPASERFVESFGMAFLMPATGVRRQFAEIVRSTNDFQVADLCRLSHFYYVSVQAMTLRLEQLSLIPAGTYQDLVDRGFKPHTARAELALEQSLPDPNWICPLRYRILAAKAFEEELISEGQLARFLRTDRVDARRIVMEMRPYLVLHSDGNYVELPGDYSLLRKQG